MIFLQPNAEAATLNRVHSAWASRIDGTVTANGRVIIQNGNGVLFGGTARIDIGSLVATTLDVNTRQFIDSGNLVLHGGGTGAEVRNAGTITAADRGFVGLIGSKVTNGGLIRARLGSVALAAGSAATIDFAGDGLVQVAITDPVSHDLTDAGALVTNRGRISADGGSVLLTARSARDVLASAINLDGLIEARSVGTQAGKVALIGDNAGGVELGSSARIDASGSVGGSVALTGGSVRIADGAAIDASAAGRGGTILVGGGIRGSGTLPHALDVTVAQGAKLDASGGDAGGAIVLWSDRSTLFDGTARAEARNRGAHGGLVETSSAGRLIVGDHALVSTASPNGGAGTWLLDPTSISIVASGGSASSPDDANSAPGASTINASTVVTALASNNVQLVADDLISVDAPIVATSLGGSLRGLELITTGPGSDIHVNAPILLQNGNLALRAEGDILLGTPGSTETDFTRRAILATGTGTLWMQTRATGSILQADNSAILSENIAAIGGTVSLGSWDNYTLNLAGEARDGAFLFRETNASNVSPIGTVVDPFTLQSLSGVSQQSKTLLETQKLVSTQAPTPVDQVRTLALTGSLAGQTFDTIIFSALPYEPLPGNSLPPDPAMTDSSDYGVRSLSYSLGGSSYSITPETPVGNRPVGFQLEAAGGSVIAWVNSGFTDQAWGVEGFSGVGGTDPQEIGYHPQQSISENLIVSFGGQISSVTAAIRLLFAPDFQIPFAEVAQFEYYRTTRSAGTVEIRQAPLSGTPSPVSREYGLPNPVFTFQSPGPTFLDVDQYVSSQIAGYELVGPEISTTATQLSPVGVYPLTVTPPPASGFASRRYINDFTDSTLTITPAPLSITSDNFQKIYGNADPLLTFSVTGLRNNEVAEAVLSGAQSRVPGENVGNYATNIGTLAPDTNYFIASFTPGILQILPRPLLVRADDDSRIYGDPNPAWIAPGQTSHFSLSGFAFDDAATTGLSSVDFATAATLTSPVGAYGITPSGGVLTGPAAGNYTLSYVDGTLTIDPARLLVAARDAVRVYGEANPPFHFDVSGWRNGDEAFNSVAATLGTAATVTSNVGAYPIDILSSLLSGPGAANYTLVNSPGTLTITPAQLTVSADDLSRVYGDPNPALTSSVTGWLNGDDATTSVSSILSTLATLTSNVGGYAINVDSATLSGSAAGNYTIDSVAGLLTITPAPLLVSADDKSRIYGDANPLLTASAEGWRNNDAALYTVSASLSTTATPTSHVGQAPISVASAAILGPNPANYTIATSNGILTITPATLTVGAHDAIRVYGEPNPAFHFGVSGWRNGDEAVNSVAATLGTSATVTSNVGAYPIDILSSLLSGPNSGDYLLANLPGTLTITPARLTVSADDQSRVFGEPNPLLTATTTGWKNNDDATTTVNAVLSTAATIASPVGSYVINVDSASLSGPAALNYVLVRLPGTLLVTPAPLLLVSADNYSRVYGDPNPIFTFQVAGWRNDDEQNNSVTATLGTPATVTSNVGDYAITVSNPAILGPAAGNYLLQTQDGILTITPAPLLVSANDLRRIYGDPNPLLTASADGWRNNDEALYTIDASLSTTATLTSHVGQLPITVDAAAILGPNPANYTLTTSNGVLTITPATLTVGAHDAIRVYGEPNPAFSYIVSGWRNGDEARNSIAATLGTAATVTSNVGAYPIDILSSLLSGPNSGDYLLANLPGTLTITPAPLLVTGDHLTRVFGDPDPLLTFRVEGLRNADTASSVLTGRLRRVPGEDVGIYPVLSGSLALASPNYVLTYVNGSLTITPAPLIVRADPNEKFYGSPDPLLTWQVEGLRLGGTIDIFTGEVVRDPGEDVGVFTIRQGTLAITSPNYVLDFIEAPFVIKPRLGDLGMLASRSFDPWRIRRLERGRDPDTPGDAVYRTTPYENPYIPDPLMRAYALGYVQLGDAGPTDWRRIDNDRTGQHADRPRVQPPCPSSELQTAMLCRADGFLRDFWTVAK